MADVTSTTTTDATKAFGDALSYAKDNIANMLPEIQTYVSNLEDVSKMSDESVLKLGLLTTVLSRNNTAFSGLNVSIDGFANQLTSLGIPLDGTLGKIAKAADGALKLQTNFLHMAAATGSLGKVYQEYGNDLNNINAGLYKQTQMLNAAEIATGLSGATIESYYTQLGKVPGALENNVKGLSVMGRETTMLTAAIKLSMGSGREFKDIADDLTLAFKNYSLTGADALRFSARMGEVANNLGIDLQSVQQHLSTTSSEFAQFTRGMESGVRMTESLARITNEYVTALKGVGLSGNQALDVVHGLEMGIRNLNMGQRAFLSAQTGGPGGLQGAFQIENLMRQGKLDEVVQKARQQMSSQLGNIVSIEQAASDPAMAAQRARQMAIVKQGPLGALTGGDETKAGNLLDAMKAMDEGKYKAESLKDQIVGETIDKGTAIASKSYSELTKIRTIVENQQRVGGIATLGVVESGFTAGSGTKGSQIDPRRGQFMKSGDTYMTDTKEGSGQQLTVQGIKSFISELSGLPVTIKSTISGLGKALMGGEKGEAIESRANMLKQDLARREQKAGFKGNEEEQRIAGQEKYMLGMYEKYKKGEKVYDYEMPGDQVDMATRNSVKDTPAARAAAAKSAGTTGSRGQIDVHVTGYCLKCKNEIEDDPQTRSINPASY